MTVKNGSKWERRSEKTAPVAAAVEAARLHHRRPQFEHRPAECQKRQPSQPLVRLEREAVPRLVWEVCLHRGQILPRADQGTGDPPFSNRPAARALLAPGRDAAAWLYVPVCNDAEESQNCASTS